MLTDLLWWDRHARVRVVGSVAVLVLGTRHKEVTPTSAGDGFHADLESHRVDVGFATICEDKGAADGAAQTTKPTARTNETFEFIKVIVLIKQTKSASK
jgi:hypothetical protein